MVGVAKIARRTFLIGSAAALGGVAFGYWAYRQPYDNPLKVNPTAGDVALTPYVLVNADGVTIITPRGEMGQGVQSTLAALVAEELDVAWGDVKFLHGPASHAYFNAAVLEEALPFAPTDQSWTANSMRDFVHVPAKFLGLQITGGSSSIKDAFHKMRLAGAAARETLKLAAAKKLGISAVRLKTKDGFVVTPDGKKLSYSSLANIAATLTPPSSPSLKSRRQWKLLGKSQPRLDMVDKCMGTAKFGLDVRLPGMLFATLKRNPRQGGKLMKIDDRNARKIKGVKKIIKFEDGVAVVATNSWIAMRAADAISYDWGPATYPNTTAQHFAAVEASFVDKRLNMRNRDDGDVAAGLEEGKAITGVYKVPYQAHATMEPLNSAALYKDGKLEVWSGNQAPTICRSAAAKAVRLPEDKVEINTVFMGGGFGRRSEVDHVVYAAKVAKAMAGTPVLTTWSREEDMQHDVYRPLAMARFRATVKDGKPHAVDLSVAAPSVLEGLSARGAAPFSMPKGSPDATIAQAIWDQPYGIKHYRASAYQAPTLAPIGAWRSVGASQNAFFHECMMDEIANAAGADPLKMRLELMTHAPSRKVLEAVGAMSGWGTPLAKGRARGLAFCLSFSVPTAEVVEIEQTAKGLKVVKVFAVADVGIALDPVNIEAQLMSGIIFGLGAAISGEITFADGQAVQSNYHDYEPMRLYQAPDIEVRILENGEKIQGIGEPGTPPAAPALANAIFALTGRRFRTLPLNKHIAFV